MFASRPIVLTGCPIEVSGFLIGLTSFPVCKLVVEILLVVLKSTLETFIDWKSVHSLDRMCPSVHISHKKFRKLNLTFPLKWEFARPVSAFSRARLTGSTLGCSQFFSFIKPSLIIHRLFLKAHFSSYNIVHYVYFKFILLLCQGEFFVSSLYQLNLNVHICCSASL